MEEGPDLAAPIERRGEKLGSARAEYLVGSRAVRNPNAQFADDALVVGRRRIGHNRIVFRGTKRRRQENLAPCKTQESETLSRFSSDPCEFFRVGNDANRLNLPLLHINGQDGECLTASADDQGGLTVDFL